MKPAHSALFFLIVIILFGDPVISDKLDNVNSHNSDINSQIVSLANADSVNLIKQDLRSVLSLFLIGFVGLAVVGRKRFGEKNDKENFAP